MLLGGAYLGGHLSFGMGVDLNRTAWEQRPQQWTPVLADTELAAGQLRKVDAGGVRVLLYRTAGTVYALDSTPEPCCQTRIQNGRIEVRAFT